ncbi:MAG TPA: T9SS type A sorting domain-containing protein [Chitinophagaceae bacterium]|nr:T9SS type A sorting domain-containing protein [Chitinophagaceae bacterium]
MRLVVPGDSLACVKISGNVPSTETAQTYNLSAALRVYLSNMHSVNAILEAFIPSMYPGRKTDTVINLNYYKIIVYPTPCWPTGIVSQTAPRFQMTDVSPNPATTLCRISFESDKKAITDIQWFNALGESVYSTSIPAQQGMNYLLVPTATLPNGLYYCTLSQGAHKISTRISVLNN